MGTTTPGEVGADASDLAELLTDHLAKVDEHIEEHVAPLLEVFDPGPEETSTEAAAEAG